jgi:hypothetical protein
MSGAAKKSHRPTLVRGDEVGGGLRQVPPD